MSENVNRPDSVIAKEYWDGFRARNSSIIVDLMYGQLKSTVTCLSCSRIATAFDPYVSVCLPIVKEETAEFIFASTISHDRIEEGGEVDYEPRPFTVVDTVITKAMRVKNIKAKMVETLNLQGISASDLIIANQRQGEIKDILDDNYCVMDIDQDREYTMVYHVPDQSEDTSVVEF